MYTLMVNDYYVYLATVCSWDYVHYIIIMSTNVYLKRDGIKVQKQVNAAT